MKIMTAMYSLKRGGAYDRFMMMVHALLERQAEVHCLSLTPIPVHHELYHNHLVRVPFKSGTGLMAKAMILIFFPFHSFWIAWREQIDLFVSFSSLYAFIQGIPKCLVRRKMVTFIRGDSSSGLEAQGAPRLLLWANHQVEFLGLLFSDRIITVNRDFRERVLKIMRKQHRREVSVLYNNIPPLSPSIPGEPMEIRQRYGIPEYSKLIVTAGVLHRGKNIETLLNSLVRIDHENLFLFVIGEGRTPADAQYERSLRGMTENLGLSQHVMFTGWLAKEVAWAIFRAADLFVLPSKSEGMPNVLLEALGCNLACFGSDIPGIREILLYRPLLFDPDNESLLAKQIEQFLCDEVFSEEIRRLCQSRKEGFSFDWEERLFQTVTENVGVSLSRWKNSGVERND
jgi:glycosyltransferase involved in cell wall biosynthesis